MDRYPFYADAQNVELSRFIPRLRYVGVERKDADNALVIINSVLLVKWQLVISLTEVSF